MPKKVRELAKDLSLKDSDLIKKLNDMGYKDMKSDDVLPDIDAVAIYNAISNVNKKAETKIVRSKSRKQSEREVKPAKVEIRAVDKAIIEAQAKRIAEEAARKRRAALEREAPAESGGRPLKTPPVGIPVPRAASAPAGRAVPMGKPMPKSAVPQKKADVPQVLHGEDAPAEEAVITTPDSATEEKAKVAKVEDIAAEEKTEAVPGEKAKPAKKSAKKTAAEEKGEEAADAEEKKTEETAKKAAPAKRAAKAKKEAEELAAEEGKAEEETDIETAAEKEDGDKPAKKPASKTKTKEKKEAEAKPAEKTVKGKVDIEAVAPEGTDLPKLDEEAEEKKPIDLSEFVPAFNVKIIRTASEDAARIKAAKERAAEKAAEKASAEDSPKAERKKRTSGRQKDSEDAKAQRSARPPRGKHPRSEASIESGERDFKSGSAPSRRTSSARSEGKRREGSREKVLVYTAPTGGKDARRSRTKDKARRDRFVDTVPDLTKTTLKKYRREKVKTAEEEAMEALEALPEGSVVIDVPITVAGYCEQTGLSTAEVIMTLMKMGIMANINQNLDEETAVLLGMEFGLNIVVSSSEEEILEEGIEDFEDKEKDLRPRPPVITVMGHVDHGKTSLLDAIRKTDVTEGEAGGITQHIGASEVELDGNRIVFLDTPGHEAFTAMRARGAHITDIAVLVVAADDSVKPQTVESISHAKAAGVPIIVAINKMDKPTANPDRVKKDLSEHGVLVEEWGGDVIAVPVSAHTGEGIKQLLEMILLQAEVMELKANPSRMALGTVIEAKLDKTRGPVATLLVANGTLKSGMAIVAGTSYGRIRVMSNHKGETIHKAGPATAVEITGLDEVPQSGDEFNAVKEDRIAREIAESRKIRFREEVLARNASVTLEQLFSQISEGEIKELNLIVKADVQGSVEALEQSLEKLHTENVKVRIIHSGVGTVTESDVMLAETSNAVIIGFNVRPNSAVSAMAEMSGVQIRTYRVIYEIIDDIEAAMKGMLDPVYREVILGKMEVRETFRVPGAGVIAGVYVTEGKVARNADLRLIRDGIVVHEGKVSSLRRFKDDVREVATGYECGVGIEKYNDIKEGDIIEAFKMEEIERD